jgi:hypothetical protein
VADEEVIREKAAVAAVRYIVENIMLIEEQIT